MISSPSAQIVNALAESISVTSYSGKRVNAYGPVMGVATAIIALGIAVTTAFGPEKRGRAFESAPAAGVVLAKEKEIDDMESQAEGKTGHADEVRVEKA